jgi:signal transduction histidine kinase
MSGRAARRIVPLVMPDDVSPWRRPCASRSWVPRTVATVFFTTFLVLVTSHIPAGGADRELDAVGYGLLVAAGGSLALSGRRPRLVVGIDAIVLGSYVGRQYANGPIYLAGMIALFLLSVRTDRRTALTGAVVMCGVLGVTDAVVDQRVSPLSAVFVGWAAAAVFLGEALRNRRSYLIELQERARSLEHTRQEEARRRVAEDRLHLARDLHDSVAHAMATINVQAGAAAHVVDRRPEAAREALDAIRRASGDVLDELNAMLTLLRDDGETAARKPTPGIAQIADLVATTREARLPVDLAIEGPVTEVAKPVSTAAYRIVQESLTNVLRHAAATHATVVVRAHADGRVAVEVRDDGRGTPASATGAGAGVGIRGMCERAEATGGRLEAGREVGGFVVRAIWDARSSDARS